MRTIRTFVAVSIPESIRTQIADFQKILRQHHADIKWIRQESIHITLKFLGDVEEERVTEIGDALQMCVREYSPFSVELSDTGVFPNSHRPRVLWVGIQNGAEGLSNLSLAIDKSLQDFGFEPEKRRFSAHVTFGRVRSPHGLDPIIREMTSLGFRADSFDVHSVELMKSDLKPAGAVYTVLKNLQLQG